ncbi:MAG: Na/Pi cotransporter family protein [Erysipelotrichaceae bacterium]|nr:Na/Pi cotransporter family protein [Erysipelotrichaceae bacterium]
METLYNIMFLLASIGLFILSTQIISEGLESLADRKVKSMFSKISSKRLPNVGIGIATTAIVQSSSATTVMTIGLVNAAVITLLQATYIIMGANIGTTITAQIAALQSYSFTDIFLIFTFIGVLMNVLSKKDMVKKIGYALVGLGLIFFSIKCMTLSVSTLKDNPVFVDILTSISNPFLLLLAGAVFTAIVQSSSVMTGILIAIVANGLVIGNGGNSFLYVILGTNIGTCISAAIASVGANANGKRTALIHLLFNLIGSLLFFIFLVIYRDFAVEVLAKLFKHQSTQIAMFHTFFNVVTTLVLLPFAGALVKVATRLIKDNGEKGTSLKYIDDRLLKTPSIAVSMAIKEINYLYNDAKESLVLASDDLMNKSTKHFNKAVALKEKVSKSNVLITEFLIKLTSSKLSEKERVRVSSLHHVISDIDRISDLAVGIERCSQGIEKDNINFTETAYQDIKVMLDKLWELSDVSFDTFNKRDIKLLEKTEKVEDELDVLRKKAVDNHIERLSNKECEIISGGVYERIVNDLERIGDHMTFIARSIIEVAHIN